MRIILLSLRICPILILYSYCTKCQTLDRKFAGTNGTINTVVTYGDSVYIGGAFTQVGIGAQCMARFSNGITKPDADFPEVGNDNTLLVTEPDGNGGAYLLGYFTSYNGVSITGTSIIHILNGGALDTAFGTVTTDNSYFTAAKKIGNVLYVSGAFLTIQGVNNRQYLAALNATTGAILPWTPPVIDSYIQNIEAEDSLVFIANGFTELEGFYQPYQFAVLSANTGKIVNDFPKPLNGYSNTINTYGNSLYLSGDFSNLGQYAQGLLKMNNTSAKGDADYPQTNGSVYAVLSDGNGGYFIGGSFTVVGNQNRQNLAHIESDGTVDPAFNVSVNSSINCLAADGTNLYFGGNFTRVNTTTRNYCASVLMSNGALTAFNPNLDNYVNTVEVSGSTVYLGGNFSTIRGASRPYAAAISTDNTVTTWNPAPNGYVSKLVLNNNGTSVFMAGIFTTVKALNFRYLAKVSATTGVPSSWKPQPDGDVFGMYLSGSKLYVGGYFSAVHGVAKQFFAEIDTTSNYPTALQADLDNVPLTFYVNNNNLYLGGYFTNIQGVSRNYIARLDLTTGLVDNWQPKINSYVRSLDADANNVYVGGDFSSLITAARQTLAEIDVSSRLATPFSTPVTHTGTILSFLKNGNNLILGSNSSFNDGTKDHYYLIGLSSSTGNVSADFTNKYPNGSVDRLIVNNGKLVVSGAFSDVMNASAVSLGKRQRVAAYDLSTFSLSSDVYDPNNSVIGMYNDANGKLVLTGSFTLMNYADRQYAASIDMNTGTVTNWNPSPNGYINAIAVKDATAYIGGNFTQVNTTPVTRNYLAAVNTTIGAATSWIANANNPVYALAIKDTLLYVGGDFTVIKSAGRSRGAALSLANAAVKGWIPGANGRISAILPVDTTVYIGGQFTTVKGEARNYLAQCNTFNGNPLNWSPHPDSYILSMVNTGKTLYVGGNFNTIAGATRNQLAAFDIANNSLTNFDAALQYTGYAINCFAPYGKLLFLGSDYYNYIGTSTRGNLACLDTSTRQATAFDPMPDGTINCLAVGKNKLFAGGSFYQLNQNLSPSYLAVFTLEPQTAASNLSFTNVLATSVRANWMNGSGENRLVVVKEDAAPAGLADGYDYTANSAFGAGSLIGAGGRAVYNGSGSSVNVTNLLPNHTYFFAVFEYNGSSTSTDYQQSPVLLGSITTPCLIYTDVITPSDTVYVCAGKTTVLTAPSGFSTYSWSNGKTTVKDTVGAGKYTVTVDDGSGCVYTTPAVYVKEYTVAAPVINAYGPVTFCKGDSVTLSVSGGNFTGVLWSNGETTPTVKIKVSGSYTVTATEAVHGCAATSLATVIKVNQPTGSDTVVSVCNQYFWNNSTYKVSGDFVYHTINAAGCDSTATLHLTILSVTSTYTKKDAGCFGTATGSITIHPIYGLSPFTYRIGTTGSYVSSNTFGNLKAGNYRVSILDANGCAGISSQIVIGQQPPITASYTKTDASCNSSATGSISVTPTNGLSPYAYRLGSSGSFVPSNTFNNLRAGFYRITIADANKCEGTISDIIIAEPLPIKVSFSTTNVSCYGQATGSITAVPQAGLGSYLFKLGTSGSYGNYNIFSNLKAGNYMVYIKDANNCIVFSSINVTQPAAPLKVSVVKTDESCPGGKDGSIVANGAGGFAPYYFRLGTTGSYSSTNTFNNLKAGTYRVFITDANKCSGGSVGVSVAQTSPTCSPLMVTKLSEFTSSQLVKVHVLQAHLYPNPAKGIFKLQVITDSPRPVTIRVIDINGRIVYGTTGVANQQFIFGEQLSTGTYLVKVSQGNNIQSISAIKIK